MCPNPEAVDGLAQAGPRKPGKGAGGALASANIVAIFYPFSQCCEMNISLLSLQTQPNTAPNLFQRGVEYGKYGEAGSCRARHFLEHATSAPPQGAQHRLDLERQLRIAPPKAAGAEVAHSCKRHVWQCLHNSYSRV